MTPQVLPSSIYPRLRFLLPGGRSARRRHCLQQNPKVEAPQRRLPHHKRVLRLVGTRSNRHCRVPYSVGCTLLIVISSVWGSMRRPSRTHLGPLSSYVRLGRVPERNKSCNNLVNILKIIETVSIRNQHATVANFPRHPSENKCPQSIDNLHFSRMAPFIS